MAEEKKNEVTQESIDQSIADQLGPMVAEAIAKAMEKGGDTQRTEPPIDEERGSIVRARRWELKPGQEGIAAARMVRALAFGRGDPGRAKHFVKNVYNDDLGDEITKALTATDPTAAGNLVLPEYAAEIIELLRSRTVIRQAGARTLPMANGSLTIRKQTTGSSASYVGESENIPTTNPELGLITLVSKKLAAIVPISNDLLAFTSSPSADEFVRDDLVMEMSIREDRAFLRDDGTQHTPKGLRHWAHPDNISASNGTTSAQIEADFKDQINDLEGKDVRLLRPAWLMHPFQKNHLYNLRDGNGNLIYPEMRAAQPRMYNYPVFVSTSIPNNLGGGGNESEIYFVDFVDAIIGEASSLEIGVDSSAAYVENSVVQSAFSRDETLVRAITRHDFAMRHRESISIKNEITWGN